MNSLRTYRECWCALPLYEKYRYWISVRILREERAATFDRLRFWPHRFAKRFLSLFWTPQHSAWKCKRRTRREERLWLVSYLAILWSRETYVLWNPVVRDHIYEIQPLVRMSSQMNPVHILTLHCVKSHFNIILSNPRSRDQSLETKLLCCVLYPQHIWWFSRESWENLVPVLISVCFYCHWRTRTDYRIAHDSTMWPFWRRGQMNCVWS